MKKLIRNWVANISEENDRKEVLEMIDRLETSTEPTITVTSPKYESSNDQIRDEIKLWTASCANDPDNILSPIRAPSKRKLKDLFVLAAKKMKKNNTVESEIRFKEIKQDDFSILFDVIDAQGGDTNEFVVIFPEGYHLDSVKTPLRVITRVIHNEKFVTFVVHLNKFIEKETKSGNRVNVTVLLTKASELYTKIVSGEEVDSDDDESLGLDRMYLSDDAHDDIDVDESETRRFYAHVWGNESTEEDLPPMNARKNIMKQLIGLVEHKEGYVFVFWFLTVIDSQCA